GGGKARTVNGVRGLEVQTGEDAVLRVVLRRRDRAVCCQGNVDWRRYRNDVGPGFNFRDARYAVYSSIGYYANLRGCQGRESDLLPDEIIAGDGAAGNGGPGAAGPILHSERSGSIVRECLRGIGISLCLVIISVGEDVDLSDHLRAVEVDLDPGGQAVLVTPVM